MAQSYQVSVAFRGCLKSHVCVKCFACRALSFVAEYFSLPKNLIPFETAPLQTMEFKETI